MDIITMSTTMFGPILGNIMILINTDPEGVTLSAFGSGEHNASHLED